MGGILPSFDFFDVVNIGERPRSSGNNTFEVEEAVEETSIEEDTFTIQTRPTRPTVSARTQPPTRKPVKNDDTFTAYESRDIYKDESETEPEDNEIDTSIVVVNQKGEERKLLRGKRQVPSPWYWINNHNDGRTCYAALPGDIVRYAKVMISRKVSQ